MTLKQETIVAISLGYIVESIRRAGEYSGDISENVINYIVEEVREQPKRQQGKSG
jgi:hypothetical protein